MLATKRCAKCIHFNKSKRFCRKVCMPIGNVFVCAYIEYKQQFKQEESHDKERAVKEAALVV